MGYNSQEHHAAILLTQPWLPQQRRRSRLMVHSLLDQPLGHSAALLPNWVSTLGLAASPPTLLCR
jgi:hypothetical protein